VRRFSTDPARIADSVRLGAEAMAAALGIAPPALPAPAPPRRAAIRMPRALRAGAGAALRRPV
jgi:hypothetical protein